MVLKERATGGRKEKEKNKNKEKARREGNKAEKAKKEQGWNGMGSALSFDPPGKCMGFFPLAAIRHKEKAA